MRLITQLIAGAATAAIGALAVAQPAAGMSGDTAMAVSAARMPVAGDSSYPPVAHTALSASRSRAAVAAEAMAALAAGAIARGDLPASELGVRLPSSEKTRIQVRAETLEAYRLGLLDQPGELGLPGITPEQQQMIRAAGLRARDQVSIQAAG